MTDRLSEIEAIRERLKRSEQCNPPHAKWVPTLFCWQGDVGFLLQAIAERDKEIERLSMDLDEEAAYREHFQTESSQLAERIAELEELAAKPGEWERNNDKWNV